MTTLEQAQATAALAHRFLADAIRERPDEKFFRQYPDDVVLGVSPSGLSSDGRRAWADAIVARWREKFERGEWDDGQIVTRMNESHGRTQAEVLAYMDRAVQLAEKALAAK